ncbi:MAG: hypothetical protein WA131_03990 [Desulfitobacteriaceae bacterium]
MSTIGKQLNCGVGRKSELPHHCRRLLTENDSKSQDMLFAAPGFADCFCNCSHTI